MLRGGLRVGVVGIVCAVVPLAIACGTKFESAPPGVIETGDGGGEGGTSSGVTPTPPPGSGGPCPQAPMSPAGAGNCVDLMLGQEQGTLESTEAPPMMTGGMLPDGLYVIASHTYYTNAGGSDDGGTVLMDETSAQNVEVFTANGFHYFTWDATFNGGAQQQFGGNLCTTGNTLYLYLHCGPVGANTLVPLTYSFDPTTKDVSIQGSDIFLKRSGTPPYPEVVVLSPTAK